MEYTEAIRYAKLVLRVIKCEIKELAAEYGVEVVDE